MSITALSPKRARFVSEYVETGNASEAARQAGYAASGAHVTGSRLLRDAKVAAAIEAERESLRVRARLDQDTLISELLSLHAEARSKGSYSAAARCLGMVAHMTGLDEPEQVSHADQVLKLLSERLPPPRRALIPASGHSGQ